MALVLTPISTTDALEFNRRHHRHNPHAPSCPQFSVAVSRGVDIVGVAIIGRPTARALCNGWTAEVQRLCTTGERNAPSMLYQAAWRAARALGYRRLVTYTLLTESGASLRGAGWTLIGEIRKRSWDTPGRPRIDKIPPQRKFRWEREAR